VNRLARLLLSGAVASIGSVASAQIPALESVRVASGLTLPVYVTAPPGDARLFVVEQGGRIRIARNGAVDPTPFLDLSSQVVCCGGRGLLGLAFAPDYATSGLFYVHYVRPGGANGNGFIRVDRFQVSADPDVADPASQEMLLDVGEHPSLSHHGGQLAFGPDGMLYVALGDGAVYPSPSPAQDDASLLGKLLRIDVSGGPGSGYSVPPSNPFVGPGPPLDEIWSKGLRNPSRASFDPASGALYIGDIGQASREELDVQPVASSGGENWGWDVMEGTLCLQPGNPACTDGSLEPPVYDYPTTGGNCAITGGAVYRGVLPGLQGRYFFSDFCSGRVWSLAWNGAGGYTDFQEWTSQLDPGGSFEIITAVERGGSGELHLVDWTAGRVYRVISANECADGLDNDGDGLVDAAADPGCGGSPTANREEPQCDDELDNDGDGRTDWDGGTGGGSADPQCAGQAWRDKESKARCGLGGEIGVVVGTLGALRRRRAVRAFAAACPRGSG
jgi:glucose/arabinose dehydrogenase